ncbi:MULTISPECIES: DNA polymerase IV [unclassified Granulicatella]|uniref:DNA polymerase IV n=1 Tax=unclassified Granulicatella TaxID=2630493 RepID=UPI0010740FD3|nr:MULTISPECIES: DNA polymerase IV [unclassified Granulicatella]MBF0779928.1 DNA polymerase IV [Granulicatella sp. 19428wC4_WM01]TFU96039.1 DNA polymerase IV [Granulicatella sp. WM01]
MEFGILTFDYLQYHTSRKIIHIDMDAFFAAIEIRDNPNLKGKPVIMAHHPLKTKGRGVVSTCSYEARVFGIHSAMSAKKAYELCPKGIFIVPRLAYYRDISNQIRHIFKRYTDIIEFMSLDEAYLDVTHNKMGYKSAIYVAKCIQRDIWKELQLSCSAGVSYNKFLAKIASDFQKPSGLTTITPDEAIDFLEHLPIEKFYGVGKKSVSKLHAYGIYKGKDILKVDSRELVNRFGKLGFLLLQRVRGIDNSLVKAERKRKSLGRENTFFPELATSQEVQIAIRYLTQTLGKSLQKFGLKGNTVTLKVRYTDFETVTRQHKVPEMICSDQDLFGVAMGLWEDYGHLDKNIRLMGVSISNLQSQQIEEVKLDLI